MSDKFNARKGLEIGRGLAEDATIEVKNSSANFPYVKYSETEQVWKFSNDGLVEIKFGVVVARWNETTLEVMNENGEYISANLIGPAPQHTWDDTKLSFENPDGTYGEEKELMPSHEWNLSPTSKKLKFQNPSGGYGDEIDLSSYNYFFTEDKIGEVKEWIWTNCPENFLKLDGSTLQKIDNEEFFEFLIAEGEVLDTDTEYTLPTQANKIIRVKTSLNAIYKIVDSIPVGTTLQGLWDINNIPEGFIPLNGASLSPSVFPELFEHYKKNNLIDTNITIKNNSGSNLIVYYRNNGPIGSITLAANATNSTLKLNQFYNSSVDGNLLKTLDNIKNGLLKITSFDLQDARGRVLRNVDKGAGVEPTNSIIGTTQEDAIRNITGRYACESWGVSNVTGAFYKGGGGAAQDSIATNGDTSRTDYYFDANRVVPTANENRVKSIFVECIIKYKLGDGRES